ncbi:MAG TPA: aminodeoxychorismate lyase [Thiobacillus sp.]
MMLVNGRQADSISVQDRGLAYGDGVFRTMRTQSGQPLWWHDQFAKLSADCQALNLPLASEAQLHGEICQVAASGEGVVKVLMTRGSGARGYASTHIETPTRIVFSAPLPPYAGAEAPMEVAARWCTLKLARQPRLAGIKHLNRLENVLARAEWNDASTFEGILCDDHEMIVGGVMSNVFWAKNGELFTPDLNESGVAGVARARILRACMQRGVATHIGRWQRDVILAADEVMICNSVIGVRRVAKLDDTHWKPAGWTAILNDALNEA